MRATELALALHDLILKRGDIDIAVLDPTSEPVEGGSDWTGNIGLISHPYEDGTMIGLLVPHPDKLIIPEDVTVQTIFHTGQKH